MGSRITGIIGIYKITNLINGKFYIGQSRNIFQRWKQHSSNLSENSPTSRIRAAFAKYGLNQIVYKPGIYGNFKFEILETCDEIDLLDTESRFVNDLKPHYNCNILTSADYYSGIHNRNQKRYWIQYHNFDLEMGYPSQSIIDEDSNDLLSDSYHYISSAKRAILYSKGDTIFLILGKKFKNVKYYFIWSETLVEGVDFIESEDLIYNAFGEQYFMNPPILLNQIIGFKDFLKKTGNFGFGFLNISQWEFSTTIADLSFENRFLDDHNVTYKEYINNFEQLVNSLE